MAYPAPNEIKTGTREPIKKSTDLKVVIGLLALWGIFRIAIVSVLIADGSSLPVHHIAFEIIVGILLLVSAYGLWTIKKWAFNLSMLSVAIVILANLYLEIYLGVLIVGIVAYYIYKNKDLYK